MTTKIEWTDETWNPVTGCTKVSQGCKHCYAERLAPKVFAGQKVTIRASGFHGEAAQHDTIIGERLRVFTDVKCHPERIEAPLHWKKPRRVFVNSMSDLFHEDVPEEFIDKVFAAMALAPQHVYQVLTKRPARMRDYMQAVVNGQRNLCESAVEIRKSFIGGLMVATAHGVRIQEGAHPPFQPWPFLWLGVSVEDQATADERIPLLLQTPAAVRFLSCEPLLGPIDLRNLEVPRRYGSGLLDAFTLDFKTHHQEVMAGPPSGHGPIDWVIAGGESGPKARPAHPDWFRSLAEQCRATGVAFFMKQMTERGRKIPFEDFPAELQVREYPHAA